MNKAKYNSNNDIVLSIHNDTNNPTILCYVEHTITSNNFIINFSSCILHSLCNLSTVYSTLYDNKKLVSSFILQESGYGITNKNNIITIQSIGSKNRNIPSIQLFIDIPSNNVYTCIEDLAIAIRQTFLRSKNNNEYGIDLSKSTIQFKLDQTTGNIICELSINIQVQLKSSDYTLYLIDTDTDTDPNPNTAIDTGNGNDNIRNSWFTHLGFLPTYKLLQKRYTTIYYN
jgi:hypothetical protein